MTQVDEGVAWVDTRPRTPETIVADVERRLREHQQPNHPDTLCLWLKVADLKLRIEGR